MKFLKENGWLLYGLVNWCIVGFALGWMFHTIGITDRGFGIVFWILFTFSLFFSCFKHD